MTTHDLPDPDPQDDRLAEAIPNLILGLIERRAKGAPDLDFDAYVEVYFDRLKAFVKEQWAASHAVRVMGASRN